jgi:hypothetical protein
MSIIKYTITFLAGVYIGQEYGNTLPSVKAYTEKIYESFKKTEFYKRIEDDVNKVRK